MMNMAEQHTSLLLPLLKRWQQDANVGSHMPHSYLAEETENSPSCALLCGSERLDSMVEGHPCLLIVPAEEYPLFFDLVGAEVTFPKEMIPVFQPV